MAAKITPIFEGSSFNLMFGESLIQEYYIMEGLTPALSQGELAAASVLVAGLPPMFSAHVQSAYRSLYVSGYTGTPWPEQQGSTARTSNRVCVHYGRPSPEHPLGGTYMELRGSNGEIILNRWPYGDQQGEPILVACNAAQIGDTSKTFLDQIPPSAVPFALAHNTGTQFDPVEIPAPNPNWYLTLVVMQTSALIASSALFRRGINNAAWFGFDPYTVVCRDIADRQVFGCGLVPDHFVTVFEFEIAPDPSYWFRTEFFRDWNTGKMVAGIDVLDGTNNGYVWMLPWNPIDFNSLVFPHFSSPTFTNPAWGTLTPGGPPPP